MYGWRGRIGLMVPTGNSVMEPEFQRMAPDGVTTHANRVELKDVTPTRPCHRWPTTPSLPNRATAAGGAAMAPAVRRRRSGVWRAAPGHRR